MSSMLRFAYSSSEDMHVVAWKHHLAGNSLSKACRLDTREDRRNAVLEAVKSQGVPDCHVGSICSTAMAMLGHGGGF